MSLIVCPDPTAMSNWHTGLAATSVLLLLALLLALLTLWRARRVGVAPMLVTALSAIVVVATEVTSVALWLRFRDTIAGLAMYFPQYPTSCVTADDLYGHFSPPPAFYETLQHIIAQVAPLERVAEVDMAVAAGAVLAVIVCALLWGRRRTSVPITV